MGAFAAAAHELEHVGRNEDLPGRVPGHREVDDDAAVGEIGHPLQEIVHRQPRQVLERHLAFVGRNVRRATPSQ